MTNESQSSLTDDSLTNKETDNINLKDKAMNELQTIANSNSKSLGILQPFSPKTNPDDYQILNNKVPGTYPMFEDEGSKINYGDSGSSNDNNKNEGDNNKEQAPLKKNKNGVILNPQPSDHDKDPLNWPHWKKEIALLALGLHCFLGGGQSSMLASGGSLLKTEYKQDSTKISYLVGLLMIAMGLGSVIASPTSFILGKRVVYLIGIAIFFFGAIGCALSNSYGALLVCRIICGFGVSTVESLPSATISEIYFSYERAYRTGIYTFLLLGGKNLLPMISSFIFQKKGTHWLFWIMAIIAGFNFFSHLFFVPETFWNRSPVPSERSIEESKLARKMGYKLPKMAIDDNDDENGNNDNETVDVHSLTSNDFSPEVEFVTRDPTTGRIINNMNEVEAVFDSDDEDLSAGENMTLDKPISGDDSSALSKAKTRRQSVPKSLAESHFTTGLSLYNGKISAQKWKLVLLRPFILYSFPHICYASFVYSFSVVWLIVICEVIAEIFTNKETYNFTIIETGLVYISPFIGGCIGSLLGGKISDFVVRKCSKWNNGLYEPEFRLFMILPAILTTTIGLFGFGWSAQIHDHWIVPVIFFGVMSFGCSLASTSGITLAIDAHKNFAQEALVTFNLTKNILGFVFSLFNNKFAAKKGYKTVFIIYGCIEIALGLIAIPLYFYGKRMRKWVDDRHSIDFTYKLRKKKVNKKNNNNTIFKLKKIIKS
ncbi:MFS general substrate transporter, partial [Hanseniaspora valbyensis NRRL Y-1626]